MNEESTLKYNIGDKFWMVTRLRNFNTEKIKMIDEDGIEWYRYPAGTHKYTITASKIIGKVHITTEGDDSCWLDNEYVDHYSILYEDGGSDTIYEEELDNAVGYDGVFFRSFDEAQEYIEKLIAEE